MSRKKVLLLNPPGDKIYLRDYYCSKLSKGDYIYHPVDLLVQSGWLAKDFEVKVMDCIVERIPAEDAEKKILAWKPDAVFFITGAVSKPIDQEFLSKIKAKLDCVTIGSGDYLLGDFADAKQEAPWLDAAVLDFTTGDIAAYLRHKLLGSEETWENLVDFTQESIEFPKRVKSREMPIPCPRYELFPNELYTYPFVSRMPFATVMASYGCPWQCHFCVMPGIGYKHQPLENLIAEFDRIKELGFKDIYFSDQTFGARPGLLKQICEVMIEKNYGFKWVAFYRVDLVKSETLDLMRRAGCRLLMFGIESNLQRILDVQRKGITLEQIRQAFKTCRKHKIKTVATFIVGLPGTTYQENLEMLDFALELNPDYASFNVLVPRMGTEIRKEAHENEWVIDTDGVMDQTGSIGTLKTDHLTPEQIVDLRKKLNRGFYRRPSYLLKRLFGIRSLHELKLLVSNGLAVLKGN